MSSRFVHLMAGAAIAILCMCAPMAFAEADFNGEDAPVFRELASAEPRLVYSEDWSGGTGGWNAGASYEDSGRAPVRVRIGIPQAQYGMYFWGSCGWAIYGRRVPEVPIKVSITGYILSANRNALSVNVRSGGGGAIYKYGFCAGVIGANKQPPTWTYRDTDLGYRTETPYELYSIWAPNTGRFALGLKNLATGEDRMSRALWGCRSGDIPGGIDIDQEGGRGPALLGRVAVYLYY